MSDSIEMNYYEPETTTWTVNLDGRYMSAVQNYLLADGIPLEGVTRIVSNAAQTLSYCPYPEGNGTCQKTGIVIGKVQSGKTSNFISITALAFDNNYDIVIVFGGTKKPLVKQNRDRIKEYFEATKDVLVLDTTDFKDQLTAQKMHQFNKMNKKVVVVALKSPTQINYIADNIFSDPTLAEKPVLIIDDEGDEASLNTLVKKGKKSSTYKAIENLKARLNRHCFLSITATPQANLLIDTLDVLSPDFGVLVDPGNGYCGMPSSSREVSLSGIFFLYLLSLWYTSRPQYPLPGSTSIQRKYRIMKPPCWMTAFHNRLLKLFRCFLLPVQYTKIVV